MKDVLAELYGKRFVTEKKDEKGVVAGAVPVGQPVMGKKPELTKDTGPEAVKGIKKPEQGPSVEPNQTKKEILGDGKFKESVSISSFDKLYATVITEDDDLDQVIGDENGAGDENSAGDEITSDEIGGEENVEEEEDERVTRLKAIRDELDAVIMDIEGEQESEEGNLGEEPPTEPTGNETEPEFKEAFTPHGEPRPLTAKGTELQKGQNVPGKLGSKKSSGTAKVPTTKTSTGAVSPLGKKQVPTWNRVSGGPMGAGKDAEFIT